MRRTYIRKYDGSGVGFLIKHSAMRRTGTHEHRGSSSQRIGRPLGVLNGETVLLTMALTRDVVCVDMRTPTCGVRTYENTMAQMRVF